MLKETIPEIKLFLHSFLHTIENVIFKYNNSQLFNLVLTKERDQDFIFKTILQVANEDIR